VSATRVAVVDLGSNSTRLLLAEVHPGGRVVELERRSTVTRMGEAVEATGRLAPEAVDRVLEVLAGYREAAAAADATAILGLLTSAARDARDGERLAATVAERFGIDARVLSGEEEARLTYLGATAGLPATGATAVIDVGGGSTELVVGEGRELRFHVSTQVGVVRHGERHLRADPPAPCVAALREDAARTFAAHVPPGLGAVRGIAVAGTPLQAASILAATTLSAPALEELLARLAVLPLARRRKVAGLDPARAPTIVAGVAILLEAMAALGLGAVKASEHDLLRGAALEHTAFRRARPQFSP